MLSEEWGEIGHRPVTLRSIGDSWSDVVREVCSQAGLDVVIPAGLSSKSDDDSSGSGVTVSFASTPVYDALVHLGKLRGLVPRLEGSLVSFDDPRVSTVSYIDPGYLSRDEAIEVVRSVVGTDGSVTFAGRGVTLAGGDALVGHASKLQSLFSAYAPVQWQVAVWIIEISSDTRDRLGVELALRGDLQGLWSSGSASIAAQSLLHGVIEGRHSRSDARIVNHATVTVVEGQRSVLRNVTTVPIPERSVSAEGTVTTSGYTYIDAGLILLLDARALPDGRVWLSVQPEISSISGYVEEAPVIARRSMQFTAMAEPGAYLIVAGLDELRRLSERRGLLELFAADDVSDSSVLLVMHVSQASSVSLVSDG